MRAGRTSTPARFWLAAVALGVGTFAACGSSKSDDGSKSKGGDAGAPDSGGSGGLGGASGSATGGSTTTGGRGGTSTGGRADGGAPDGGTSPGGAGVGGAAGAGGSGEAGEGGAGSVASPHALHFGGGSDVLALPTGAGAANETAFTAEVWFRTSGMTGMLFEVFATAGGADRSLYLKNSSLCFYVYAPAYSELCTTTDFDDGLWHHAAGTLGAGGQKLYVDGEPVASVLTVTASAFDSDTEFRAGYGHIGPNGPLFPYVGDLDELRVFSVERTEAQIRASYAASLSPTTAGLQGYWRLDESATASTTRDETSGMHHGSLTGFSFTPSPWITPGAF